MANQEFDVVVIGAGPGGYVAAIRAAQLGGKVAIVEKQYWGGTCLNVGCIPSKALLHTAHLMNQLRHLADFGITASQPSFDIVKAMARKNGVVKQLTGGVEQLLKSNGVTLFFGEAHVPRPGLIQITSQKGPQEIGAKNTILANGSVPIMPPLPGMDGKNVIHSDHAVDLQQVPKSMLVIGGGVIGVELACVYAAFGTKITIIEMLPRLIANEDEESSVTLLRSLKQQGMEIFLNSTVLSISDGPEGKQVQVKTEKGEQGFPAEYVLVAVGRKANPLGLELAGLEMERGKVKANTRMETNLPGIYAIGDLVGKFWLAHVASMEGEVAAENALGHHSEMDYSAVPRCIYTFPEIAAVGLNENEARAKYPGAKAEKFPWRAVGKALSTGETEGYTKVIMGPHGEILGAHIIGAEATNLITEFSLAIRLEATVEEVIGTIHPHPTLSEGLREATLAVDGRPIHMPPKKQMAKV